MESGGRFIHIYTTSLLSHHTYHSCLLLLLLISLIAHFGPLPFPRPKDAVHTLCFCFSVIYAYYQQSVSFDAKKSQTTPRASKDRKKPSIRATQILPPSSTTSSCRSPSLLRPKTLTPNSLLKQRLNAAQSSEVVVETLECVSNEGQAEFWAFLLLRRCSGAPSSLLSLEQCGVIRLVDLVRREVCGIDSGCKTGLEGRTDAAQAVELDAAEEGVALDFMSTTATETVLSVADKAYGKSASRAIRRNVLR